MFNLFKKKPKIEFINQIPGVSELMPIIEAKSFRRPWVENALKDFAVQRSDPNWKHNKLQHTARCPGIFTLQRQGWIMRTWQDIVIKTNGDRKSFEWRSASVHGGDAVSYHPEDQLYKFYSNWPENTLPLVLKFNTGWRCNVPKGYYLLEMPVTYSEETRFTTLPGFFYREAGPAHMNVQILWHVMDGEVLIKAGTPISQYLLVPKDQPEFVCREEQESDRLWLSTLYDTSKFVKNYNEVKKLFG